MATIKRKLKINNLEEVFTAVSLINNIPGHGHAYELNKVMYIIKPLIEGFHNRLNEAKTPFLMKDENGVILKFAAKTGEIADEKTPENEIGGRFIKDKLDEVNIMLSKFRNEIFEVELEQLDENKIKKVFKNSKFEGVDFSALFGVII
tara:strand:- start:2052 stop:2495 length:444 start_codon:yes stop_codon:yes gene_type:complete